MSRAGVGAVVALAFAAGLALRLVRLDVRPMHHDEANQAVKFATLLETGEYRYDAHDHHGPTLYYLTLPVAWLRGQHTLAALDEWTLRGVTVVFGAATILLLPLFASGIGRIAAAAAACLMALSPAMVFYSRMFIQESLFTCFALAFIAALGRAVTTPGMGWPIAAGAAAGLAIATKETSAIVLPATIAACALAWTSLGAERLRLAPARGRAVPVAAALAAAIAIALVFYSSFFTYPAGVLAPILGAGTYIERGTEPARHAHPWYFYLQVLGYWRSGGLTWTEALVLVLAGLGAAAAWRPVRGRRSSDEGDVDRTVRTFWTRYLAAATVLTAAIFSAIPYKTPWNLLPFYAPAIVLAGVGLASVVHAAPLRWLRLTVVVLFAAAAAHLGREAWRASVTYAADPRNPYVYSQTVPDAVRMAARIRQLAALHPDKLRMQVSVIAPPSEQWPLPWYLRTMPNVGYWPAPGDPLALRAPVIVSSLDHVPALDAALGERDVSEYFGLRPDVLLALYADRDLYDRYLAHVAAGTAGVRPPFVTAAGERGRCGAAPAVALSRAASAE